MVYEEGGQTIHVVVRQIQSLSGWAISLPLCLSFPGLLFMEEDNVQPPSTTTITVSLGLGMASVNFVFERRGRFSLDASLPNCYEGTPMEDMDEGETRGVEVEALGGEEKETMTLDDEAMYRKKVTMRPQCDRLGTEDTTQVEVV